MDGSPGLRRHLYIIILVIWLYPFDTVHGISRERDRERDTWREIRSSVMGKRLNRISLQVSFSLSPDMP